VDDFAGFMNGSCIAPPDGGEKPQKSIQNNMGQTKKQREKRTGKGCGKSVVDSGQLGEKKSGLLPRRTMQ